MTNYKDNLPPYAEELILNEEAISLQQILNQFKQPIPDKFVELKVEEGNYQFSTNPKWKEKVLCERYGFYKKQDSSEKKEWIQIDIPHTLLENLEIPKGEDITYPLYLDPQVLEKFLKGEHIRGAITIKNEKEIFLQKPFTIQNLQQSLSKLFQQIEALAREKNSNKQTIKDLEKTKNDWKNEWLTEWRKNKTLTTEREKLQKLLGINNLNNLPTLLGGETLTSLLARPTLTQLNELRREKDQQLTTENAQITNLTQQVNAWNSYFPSANGNPGLVEKEIKDLKNKLQREQGWWDKWFSYKNPFDGRKQIESEGNQNKELFQTIRTNLDLMIPATASENYFVDYHITARRYMHSSKLYLTEEVSNRTNYDFDSRKIIKAIYQYYRDR